MIDVTIEKLIYGGEGLAHHEGSTVFVPFVLPAEVAGITPVEQKKKFIRARLDKVVTPSPARIAAKCPHFGICGGCDYQHIAYEPQLEFKKEILRETLRRIGKRVAPSASLGAMEAMTSSSKRPPVRESQTMPTSWPALVWASTRSTICRKMPPIGERTTWTIFSRFGLSM